MGGILLPNYQICPLNMNHFLILSQTARRNGPISQPVEEFFKNALVKFQFCVWTRGLAGFITSPPKNRGALPP